MSIFRNLRDYFFVESPLANMQQYAVDAAPFLTARTLVRTYYYFLLFLSIGLFGPWDPSVAAQAMMEHSWAIAWIPIVGVKSAYTLIRVGFILASLLAAFFPEHRVARIVSFFALFEFVSLFISILQLDVDGYGLVLTSFMFLFLPDLPAAAGERQREQFLTVFWGATALNLLTYTMGGIGKFWGAYVQVLHGQSSLFSPHAAALHIANRLILTDSSSAWGAWAVDHPLLIYPWFLVSCYILLASFLVAFKPHLLRTWGLLILLYHAGNYLVINIGFVTHLFLWSLLLLSSPFAPERTRLYDIVRSLPLLGIVFRKIVP